MDEYEHKTRWFGEYSIPRTPEQWAPHLDGGWQVHLVTYKEPPADYADGSWIVIFQRTKAEVACSL